MAHSFAMEKRGRLPFFNSLGISPDLHSLQHMTLTPSLLVCTILLLGDRSALQNSASKVGFPVLTLCESRSTSGSSGGGVKYLQYFAKTLADTRLQSLWPSNLSHNMHTLPWRQLVCLSFTNKPLTFSLKACRFGSMLLHCEKQLSCCGALRSKGGNLHSEVQVEDAASFGLTVQGQHNLRRFNETGTRKIKKEDYH